MKTFSASVLLFFLIINIANSQVTMHVYALKGKKEAYFNVGDRVWVKYKSDSILHIHQYWHRDGDSTTWFNKGVIIAINDSCLTYSRAKKVYVVKLSKLIAIQKYKVGKYWSLQVLTSLPLFLIPYTSGASIIFSCTAGLAQPILADRFFYPMIRIDPQKTQIENNQSQTLF